MGKRYFTKSIYKKALECPTKLFYTKKPKEYADESGENDFLKALARGGFQVGALARSYYPEGHLIETLDHDEAIKQTDELLKLDKVVIFEAAFKYNDYFIRVDIFKKNGILCDLLEVKSKSADPQTFFDDIWNKTKRKKDIYALTTKWDEYIYDVAFQSYVARLSKPSVNITPYLMCADKSSESSVAGLNQKYLIRNVDGRTKVEVKGDTSPAALGKPILCELNISDAVQVILDNKEMSPKLDGLQFGQAIDFYSKNYVEDKKITPIIGKHCKACEFRCETNSLKSGFHECWEEATGLKKKELEKPLAYQVWKFLGTKELFKDKTYFIKDIIESDIEPEPTTDREGLSQSERQWLQVKMVKEGNNSEFLDTEGLKEEISKWKYPLHFIDFETCTVAVPFSSGRRPYEQIAFQFSHHMVHENGKIEHTGQFIEASPGKFPNFDFVRALKRELEGDSGTIFRYHNHENTVLNQIHDQLKVSSEPDKEGLMSWIKTITVNKTENWKGVRAMVDLCQLVTYYYFHPAAGGSNSIKAVLPAVLNESKFLQHKYAKPIYGLHGVISSQNFENTSWIQFGEDGKVKDPYKNLPKVFSDYDRETLDILMVDDDIDDGGAAMTAYAYLQFSEMTDEERSKIRSALLKYCELDTLAMVMVWEHWMDRLGLTAIRAANQKVG